MNKRDYVAFFAGAAVFFGTLGWAGSTATPAPAWQPYLPADAIADALAQPLTLLGSAKNTLTDSSIACVWKNDRVILVSGYCNLTPDSQGDVPAAEFLIYSTQGRGVVLLHAESALGKPSFDIWTVGTSDNPQFDAKNASLAFSPTMNAQAMIQAYIAFVQGTPAPQSEHQCFSLYGTVQDQQTNQKLFSACNTTLNGQVLDDSQSEEPVIQNLESFFSSQYPLWLKLFQTVSQLKH